MDDKQIIALYHQRCEQAIAETDSKYGSLCRRIAMNILSIREDAEECVNDTYHTAWLRMPPDRPQSLQAFLGRITRNISISRFRANHAKKRYQAMEIMLSELEDCVPDSTDVEQIVDARRLSSLISQWLDTLKPEEQTLFIRRYWYGDPVRTLAAERGRTPNQMAQQMYSLRKQLKTFLEAEGVSV